jgi:gliding motility-associated-like protein
VDTVEGIPYKEYINRVYVSYDNNGKEATRADNTDTALVAVRRDVDLKVAVQLCDMYNNDIPYFPGHEFRQGEKFHVRTSVVNNGWKPNNDTVKVRIKIPDALHRSLDTLLIIDADSLIPHQEWKKYYEVHAVKTEPFCVTAKASTNSGTFPVSDSATVCGSILSGANVEVKITIPVNPPFLNHDLDRLYIVSMRNIGTFTANNVTLTHKLPSPDTLKLLFAVLGFNGTRYMFPGDTTFVGLNGTLLSYDSAAQTFTYRGDLAVDSSVSLQIYATITANVVDNNLTIPLSAHAEVGNNDYNTNDNIDFAYITVFPYPYNLSVTIEPYPHELGNDKFTVVRNVPNVSDDEKQVKYTITAKNEGRYPTDSVAIDYQMWSPDIVKIVAINEMPDINNVIAPGTTTNPDINNIIASGTVINGKVWSIPQLSADSGLRYTVTVMPKSPISKGLVWHKVNISGKLVFPETNPHDNRDSARLVLYSELDSWNIMEAFSPNGDGKNDKFVIGDLRGYVVERAELVIVNRYGSEVYHSKNYKEAQEGNEAFTGSGLPEGTYFYHLTVYFNDETSDKRSGFITIRRSRWGK